jgi:ligand-binding sensor domain-containing protein
LNSGITSDYVSALGVDINNVLWVGTWGGGICKFENLIWTVYSSINSQLQDNYISSIAFDNYGILWVGLEGPGLNVDGITGASYFKNSKWYNINKLNSGFPGNYAADIAFDKNNSVWIATDAGLAKYDGKKWRIYTTSNSGLPKNIITSVSIDLNQDKWCTSTGLSKYIGGK